MSWNWSGPLNDWITFAYVFIDILELSRKGSLGETMSECKHWEAAEKLAFINKIQDKGHVGETCRKYIADPTMFYLWKKS
jgi:hypothetical protein